MNTRKRLASLATYGALTLMATVVSVPLAWMLTISLRGNLEVFSIPARWIPKQFTLVAYLNILNNPERMQLFANSYAVSAMVMLVCTFVGALAGYGLSRYRFALNHLALGYILATQMIPMVILALPYFLMMHKWGLYHTYTALVLAYSSFALPFSMLMLRDYFDTIPRELEEAAFIDGCSTVGALFRVIVPISLPGMIATAVYSFILAWNEYLFAVVLTKNWEKWPITVGISSLIGEFTTQYNELMALSVMASLPLIIVFLFVQRYLLEGLTAGGVKS